VAFLRALERSGQVRHAAKDAGVDFTTAYQRRKAHAEFAAAWVGALAAFRAAKARAEAEELEEVRRVKGKRAPPPAALAPFPTGCAGREEILFGGQVKRVGPHRWNQAAERRFFAVLADTGNVLIAADAVGFSTTALYERRLRHPVFAEKWKAAVETARASIGLGLIELAKQAIADALARMSSGPPKMTIAEALQILKLGAQPEPPAGPDGHRRLNAGTSANARAASGEEVIEALTKRLAALGKRVERERQQANRRDGGGKGTPGA
jgi:hypothetical protein